MTIRTMTRAIYLVFASLLSLGGISTASVTVKYAFTVVNYTWDESHKYAEYLSSSRYIPENNLIAGINVLSDSEIFLTVPRWRNGIPATLNRLNIETNTLTPFPSWEIQEEGKDGCLQNVQSMVIDTAKSFMWIIEVGRRNFFLPGQSVSGAPGIWVLNLQTNQIETKFYFSPEVISPDESFLNDIVLDEKRGLAYLSDAWGDGGLIVYDRLNSVARRYQGASTKNDPTYVMIINGVNYGKKIFTTPTDGIALTEDNDALFYTQVQGTTLYRIRTEYLANFSLSDADIDGRVEIIGTKQPSDGMKYINGTLYYGSLTTSTIYRLPINSTSRPNLVVEAVAETVDTDSMHWVDTFAIDCSSRKLWFTSNKLDLYSVHTMDFTPSTDNLNMHIMLVDP
jgi:Major royal jelly protein